MHHLGVSTTRAGTLVTSDTDIVRDIKYDGNIIKEKASVVLRVAPSFLRFGSFQISDIEDPYTRKCGPSYGNIQIVNDLLKYVIKHLYPDISALDKSFEIKILDFAKEITWRTIKMVVLWQSLGFTHGVLNTDNMSILGLFIDYGPFEFMDAYNPDYISNASDTEGRYKFKNQPGICKWNLEKLFDSVSLVFPNLQKEFDKILTNYSHQYHQLYLEKMRKKLGLFKELPEDYQLVKDLLDTMEKTSGDYTNIFRNLSQIKLSSKSILKQCKVQNKEHEKIWSQ